MSIFESFFNASSEDGVLSANKRPTPDSVFVFIGNKKPSSEYNYGTISIPLNDGLINFQQLTNSIADWLEEVEGNTDERYYGIDAVDDLGNDYLNISYFSADKQMKKLAVITSDELDDIFDNNDDEKFNRKALASVLDEAIRRDKQLTPGLTFDL